MQRFSPAALGSTLVLVAALAVTGCSGVQGERESSMSDQVVVAPEAQTDESSSGVTQANAAPAPTDAAIPEYLSSEGEPTTFSTVCEQSGVLETVRGLGPFTVLAPTDEAFESLGSTRLNELMDPANNDELARLVSCHIIPGRWTPEEIGRMTSVPTIGGWYIPVTKTGKEVYLGSVKLAEPSLESESLVVYTVGQVFDPQSMTSR